MKRKKMLLVIYYGKKVKNFWISYDGDSYTWH